MRIWNVLLVGSIAAFLATSCSKQEAAQGEVNAREPKEPAPVAKADPVRPPLELFGVPLKGADRKRLRQAFRDGGMTPIQEGGWVDKYNPRGVLEGATSFEAGYVIEAETFAYAEYIFNSFVDPGQISRIASLVKAKYGEPTSSTGNPNVGAASFQWDFPDGTQVRVSRNWPDTSTYLGFADAEALAKLQQQRQQLSAQQEQAKVREQSHAF